VRVSFVTTPLTVLDKYDTVAVFIFIAAAAPNKSSVGATNGLCQVGRFVSRSYLWVHVFCYIGDC